MYQNQIELTTKDILDKEFKIDTHGYRLKEVDEFLDIIMGDYEQFVSIIKDADKEKEELQDQISALKQEVRNLEASIEIAKSESSEKREVTNIDLMKRLSQLEKIVYGKED